VPAHLRGPLLRDVVAFSARLAGPGRRDGGFDVRPGVLEDVETVAAARPDLADPLAVLADRVAERLGELPAVPVHGDLWRGNLLAAGGRLTGVVDWDAARAAGPAGTDLLHLVATQERLTARRGIGAQVRRRPWSGAAFTALAADYWRSLGVQPSPAALEALGLAWWLGQVAATLRRTPELAADPAWSRRELAEVVAALVPAREGAR
jgi:aminoglycoside phosphotransferase (APT) family kinase protein